MTTATQPPAATNGRPVNPSVNGHADPWGRLRQLRDAEHEAERAWRAAHEEEQRLKRLLKAASARVAAFIDTGEEEAPLYESLDSEGVSIEDSLPSVLPPMVDGRPLSVSVDGGPAGESASVQLPVGPVRVPASEVDDGPPMRSLPSRPAQPLFDAADTPTRAEQLQLALSLTVGEAAALAAAVESDRNFGGAEGLQKAVLHKTLAGDVSLKKIGTLKWLRQAVQAHPALLLRLQHTGLPTIPGTPTTPIPQCVRCGSAGGAEVDMPSMADADNDLIPLDMCDLDLVVGPLGVKDADTPTTFVCAKCHNELIGASPPGGDTEIPRPCRVCGCTNEDCSGCIEKTGAPCHWVEPDLCSACATPEPMKKPNPAKPKRARKCPPLPKGIRIVPVGTPKFVEGTCSSCERPDCTTLDPETRRCGYCRTKEAAAEERPWQACPKCGGTGRVCRKCKHGEGRVSLKQDYCSCACPDFDLCLKCGGNGREYEKPAAKSKRKRGVQLTPTPNEDERYATMPALREREPDCGSEGPGGTTCTKEVGHAGAHRWEPSTTTKGA